MTILETTITPIVPTQLPLIIREEDPLYEAFIKAYYEWEQTEGKHTYYARNFLDFRDVDSAPTEFLLLIKEKFLKNIRLDTETNTRSLIKHATDLYQAKGTERALSLFFQLLYNEVVKIYYPKDDIFVLSDGKWKQPTYLELSLSSDNIKLEGKKVIGLTSGASAFVDGVVRRNITGKLIDTAYISAIDKNFKTGEIVAPADQSLLVSLCPTIIGSMNKVVISAQGSGFNFTVGDIIRVNSPTAIGGLARVSNTQNQSGQISVSLLDGGSNYTANAVIHVSNTVLSLANVLVTNAQATGYFPVFDRLWQDTARIFFSGATGTFSSGDQIFAWANSVIVGQGYVLTSSYTNSTAGVLSVAPQSGNLVSNTYYSLGNTIAANLNIPNGGYVDVSPNSSSMALANVMFFLAGNSNSFSVGDVITQGNPLFPADPSVLGKATVSIVSPSAIQVSNVQGYFNPGVITSGLNTANIASVSMDVGVYNVTGQFSTINRNIVRNKSITATATYVSGGLSSSFAAANNLIYSETVAINTDLLGPIQNLMINGPYGLPGNSAANSSTTFDNYLTYANVSIGTLTSIYPVTPGLLQDRPPLVFIEEPRTVDRNIFGYTLVYSGASTAFSNGEIITQATGGRGLILSVNSTAMKVREQRYSPLKAFLPTTNSTTTILGTSSGSTANLVSVQRNSSEIIFSGRDARAIATASTGNGAILTADVLDSGFGYADGEVVWLGNAPNLGPGAATGVVSTVTYGKGSGFYQQKGGFLSDQKKVFDGYYYQNFSYELASSKTLDKYQDIIKSTVHVAGMMLFGRFLHARIASTQITSAGSKYKKV
jgi:hypothetical protein